MASIGAFTITRETLIPTVFRIAFDPFVLGGLILMAMSMAGHLYVLSRVPLTFAFPFISISYIVILGVGYFVFGERLNLYHFLGTACICLGVVLIAQAGDEQFHEPKPAETAAFESSAPPQASASAAKEPHELQQNR